MICINLLHEICDAKLIFHEREKERVKGGSLSRKLRNNIYMLYAHTKYQVVHIGNVTRQLVESYSC
jgi:hypothetical protein